jgi:hypothetical protein
MILLLKPTTRKVTEFIALCSTMVILFLLARLGSHPVVLWSQIRNIRKKYGTVVLPEAMNGAVQEKTGRTRLCDTGCSGQIGVVQY